MPHPDYRLPAMLDLTMAADLKLGLLTRPADTQIDAGAVQRIAAPCLQVLAAARKSDPALKFSHVSPEFFAAVKDLALQNALGIDDA